MTTQERFLRSSERVEPEAFSRRVSDKIGDLATGIEVKYGHIWGTVEPARIVDVVTTLKTDPDLMCSYLTFLCGVDWEAEGFEVIVTLYSVTNENTVILHVPLGANPTMPTLTGVFRSANWHEREAHEMFGINFEGHPNLVKLYLPEDFIGHPLLKSFKLASRTYKPWPGAKDPSEAAGGHGVDSLIPTTDRWLTEARLGGGGTLRTEEMVLNIGPQHPATHGVLRVVVTLDGERIVDAVPVIGYMHRGHEKLFEQRDFRQITNLCSRMDWLSGINNEIPASLAVERLMELEVPRRATYLRVIMAEINRILNHLMFTGSFGLELGATTPVMYAFRERELLQSAMEMATGGRLHFGFIRPGGLKEDVPRGFVDLALRGVRQLQRAIPDYENLLLGNEIFKARTVGVGVLDPDLAVEYGVSGPILRASGVPYDVRKAEPYLNYSEFDFSIPVGLHGDSFDRYWVLIQEMKESAKIVEQALQGLPSGSHIGQVPKRLTIPKGAIWAKAENPLGELGYYIISDGEAKPYRMKARTPSFSNIQVVPHMLRGAYVPDMVAVLGSMFFVVGDIDR